MAQAPLPDRFPGDFFVITYDRDTKEYTLIVDDESHSSYKLGEDVHAIMWYLKRIKMYDVGCRALDVAREFESAQAVIADGRVMPVKQGMSFNANPFTATKKGGPVFLPRL